MYQISKGAICKDWDATPVPSAVSTDPSRTSISGAPRPLPGDGVSSPSHVHALNLWPGRYDMPSGNFDLV